MLYTKHENIYEFNVNFGEITHLVYACKLKIHSILSPQRGIFEEQADITL